MNIELNDFEKVAEFGPVSKYEQIVRTPGWPEDEAEARKVVYAVNGHKLKVSRISTLGWNVTHFDDEGRVVKRSSSRDLGYFKDESDAHQQAREWVEQVAQE